MTRTAPREPMSHSRFDLFRLVGTDNQQIHTLTDETVNLGTLQLVAFFGAKILQISELRKGNMLFYSFGGIFNKKNAIPKDDVKYVCND